MSPKKTPVYFLVKGYSCCHDQSQGKCRKRKCYLPWNITAPRLWNLPNVYKINKTICTLPPKHRNNVFKMCCGRDLRSRQDTHFIHFNTEKMHRN